MSSPLVQYSVKATIMLKDIHPLFEVMPISKSLNFKIQVFWNNSAFTATHTASVVDVADVWSAQSAQYCAYNGTIPLMLNNLTDGFGASSAGTIRVFMLVILVTIQFKKILLLFLLYQLVLLANRLNFGFLLIKC